MVKPIAEQPRRSASSTEPVTAWSGAPGRQRVGAVDLEDGRDGTGKGVSTRFQHAERGGIRVQARVDRELIMIVRVVGRGIGRKAARGAVFEPLVNRQDDQLAGAGELAVHQDAGKVGLDAGVLTFVPGQNALDALRNLHCVIP